MYRVQHTVCSHSKMNNRCYVNIFPLIQPALDREIQGLSFNAWNAVEIMGLKVVIRVFAAGSPVCSLTGQESIHCPNKCAEDHPRNQGLNTQKGE